jgi:MFS family permease
MIIATIIQVTTPIGNLAQFMIGRFILGIGAAFSGVAGLALCAELCQ